MNIAINPGSGKVENGTWEQAYINMKKFIEDCEVSMHLVRTEFEPDEDGRYLFVIDADEFDYETEIEMPGLSLENVRFVGEEGQNIWNFPRLYVDGGSWIWKYALITKENVIGVYKEKIEEKTEELEGIKTLLEDLQS